MRKAVRPLLNFLLLIASGALMNAQTTTANAQTATQSNPPTVAEAEQFIHDAEIQLQDLTVKASRACVGTVQFHH